MLADGSAEFFHFLGVHSSIWSSVFGPRRSLAALCCCCLLDACFWDVREGPGFRRRQDEGKDRSRIFVCLPLFHYFFLCEKALRLLNRIWARSRNYLWSECWNSPIVVKWLVCLFLHERMLSNPKNDSSWLFSFPKLVWASTNLPKKKKELRIWSSGSDPAAPSDPSRSWSWESIKNLWFKVFYFSALVNTFQSNY